MTLYEIIDAIHILDGWRRVAALSIGSWRCYFWRIEHQDERYARYPAPWYVDPSESMAEMYQAAANTMFAVLATKGASL